MGDFRKRNVKGEEMGERQVAEQFLEALNKETRICATSISPELRGLCLAWNMARELSYGERIFIAELLVRAATELWFA